MRDFLIHLCFEKHSSQTQKTQTQFFEANEQYMACLSIVHQFITERIPFAMPTVKSAILLSRFFVICGFCVQQIT